MAMLGFFLFAGGDQEDSDVNVGILGLLLAFFSVFTLYTVSFISVLWVSFILPLLVFSFSSPVFLCSTLSLPSSLFLVPPALRGFFFFPVFLPVQPWLCLFLPLSFSPVLPPVYAGFLLRFSPIPPPEVAFCPAFIRPEVDRRCNGRQ